MNKDYQYSFEWDEQYCYPKSNVLKNKLNITDAQQLNIAEREITSLRIAKAKDVPIKGNLDLKHLQKIHQYIFGDIYLWAGDLRNVDIAKGNQFCRKEFIEKCSNEIFEKLKKENYLLLKSREEIPLSLSYYLGEINVIHPFREGNGRTQRIFIEYLARAAGYDVDFSMVSDREMIEASALAFATDYSKMNAIFEKITTEISIEEQKESISQIIGENSNA